MGRIHHKEASASGHRKAMRKPRPRKPRCFICERRLPVETHAFRSGLRVDFCLRCAGRVIGLVERETEAANAGFDAICEACGHGAYAHRGDEGDGACMKCDCPRFGGAAFGDVQRTIT